MTRPSLDSLGAKTWAKLAMTLTSERTAFFGATVVQIDHCHSALPIGGNSDRRKGLLLVKHANWQ